MSYLIDPKSENIILISYQSGSYGHFLYYVLTHFFDKTVKIQDEAFEFDNYGTSHLLKNYSKVWYELDGENYPLDISVPYKNHEKILILCDHGHRRATDSYDVLKKFFSNSKILRVTTAGAAEPVLYNTYLIKCKEDHCIEDYTNKHVMLNWNTTEDWAARENFTLWYHNNCAYNFSEKHDSRIVNLDLADLITNTTQTLIDVGHQLDLCVIDRKQLSLFCKRWHRSQIRFFTVLSAERRLRNVLWNNNTGFSLSDITSLHDQGYLNYIIESEFNISIPVYDYQNWFKHTDEIKEMLTLLKKE